MGEGIEFRLLGGVSAVRNGRELDLGGPGLRRLLVLLLLHPGQPVAADRIADALWGDSPPSGSATALHARVSRLRRALEAGGQADVLVARPPGYVLRCDPEDVDVLRFERLVTQGRALLTAGDPAGAVGALRAGLGLWRGPALAGFADEEFCRMAAGRLEELRRCAVEDLVEARLAEGGHAEVVAEAEALTEAEPLREHRWALWMLALYRCGRQADALAAYQRLRRLLADELGISPGAEVRGLEDAILAQRAELDWRAPGPVAGGAPAPAGMPFVGRGEEFAQVEECLRASLAGHGRVVLITGEPGIGKTRLAEELARAAVTRGAAVVWGRCFEAAAAPPLWPWVQILRDLGAGEAATVAQGLAPQLDAETIPDAARLHMFTTLAAALADAAARRPVVAVLDDLQWADTASLLFLQFLAAGVADRRLLAVVTYRSVDVDTGHPIVGTLARLAPLGVTRRVALTGLDPGDVAALVGAVAGTVDRGVAEAIHERTAGNPFFVSEVARLLHGTDGPVTAIPAGVRDVVRNRVAVLSEPARTVLGAGSALGRELDAGLVEELAGLDEERFLAAVDEVLRSGLLRADEQGAGTYRFVHDIVRETVYENLSPLRRSRLHGRIAEALERRSDRGGEDHVAKVAYHFHLAALAGGNVDKAVHYALLAADQATAALAYEDAVAHLRRGVELTSLRRGDGGRARGEALLRLGDAQWRAGEVANARATFLDAADAARRLGDTDLLARAVLGFGGGLLRAWHSTRDMELRSRMIDLLEEALRGLGREDGDLRVRLLGHLAEELYYQSSQRRITLSGEAVAMARRVGLDRTLAMALCSRCLAVWDPDHLDERLAVTDEILDLAGRLGDRELAIFGRQYRFVALMEAGDIPAADATLDRFEEEAARLRQPLYLWEARRFRALQALFTGDFADAERLAFEALEMGQRAEEPDAMGVFGVQWGLVMIERGRAVEIETALKGLAEEFPDTPTWSAALAFVAVECRHDYHARDLLGQLMADDFADQPRNFAWMSGVAMLAQVAAHLGDVERSRALYRLLAPFADRNVLAADRNCWGSAALYLGMLAAAFGDLGAAEDHFEHALAMNERMGTPPWIAHTCHHYARMLRRRAVGADPDRARRLSARALAIAEDHGMSNLAEHVRTAQAER